MSQAERDAIDIFWLLYPMLDSGQKDSSEARTASGLAERYRAYTHDSTKISGYDQILAIVKKQLNTERRNPHQEHRPSPFSHPSRLEAYEQIIRMLSISHALDDVRFDDPPAEAPATRQGSGKPAAKRSGPQSRSE
jgi:hypothetical protein